MARKLSHEDSRAIDLLLDRVATAKSGNGHRAVAAGSLNVRSAKGLNKNRLNAAERVLNVLDRLPVMEPSSDLVERTMQRIEETNAIGAPGAYPRVPQTHSFGASNSRPNA